VAAGIRANIAEIDGNLSPEEALSLLGKIDELTDEQVNVLLAKIPSTNQGEEHE